ncbi:MAG: hypothetical protein EB142_07420 [Actinobacteria bacterium]|nr:hypothetical protein [Actinomycetota bacterium]
MHRMTEFVQTKMCVLAQFTALVERIFFKKAADFVAAGQKIIIRSVHGGAIGGEHGCFLWCRTIFFRQIHRLVAKFQALAVVDEVRQNILDLQRAGVNVALGTDGPASGNDIDLWIAIRLAGYMQKTFAKNPAVLPAIDIVRMATINGARALQLDHMIGSLEVGKRADLIVLDADSPSLTPNFDPHTTIATSVTRADVRHVLVDGKIIVRDRKCLTVDHKVVVDKVRALGKQVLASVGNNQ